MKIVLLNTVFFSFIGIMSYFVTPWALLILLLIQGFSENDDNKKKGT